MKIKTHYTDLAFGSLGGKTVMKIQTKHLCLKLGWVIFILSLWSFYISCIWTLPAQAQAQVTYSGRAYGASVKTAISETYIDIENTGSLASTGGLRYSTGSYVSTPDGIVKVGISANTTSGFDGVALSQAAALGASVTLNDIVLLHVSAITTTRADSTSTSSQVYINGVYFDGTQYQTIPTTSQVIAILPGFNLSIYEKTETTGKIGVTAVRLSAPSIGLDVAIARAESGVGVDPTVSSGGLLIRLSPSHEIEGGCPDFMTGGGWFIDPRIGPEKISFGFVLGIKDKNTAPSGNLNLTDHNSKMHVKSETVDHYFCGKPTGSPGICRRVEGTAQITYPDGVTGPIPAGTYSYFLYICDKGEPGNEPKGNDVFEIFLTNGASSYSFTSRADAEEGIDGGNIQHHAKKGCDPCAEFFGAPEWSELFAADISDIKNLIDRKSTGVIVKKTNVMQNFPNPFNPETWIPYQLAKPADVNLRIYNLAGKLVRILNLGRKEAGFYLTKDRAAYWDGKNQAGEHAPSGVYFYEFTADKFSAIKKMIILK